MTNVYAPSPAKDPMVLWIHDPSLAANEPPHATATPAAPPPAGGTTTPRRATTMPHGAVACTVDEALVWAHEGLPPELMARWIGGMLVQTPPDAPDLVRRAARVLRERLELRERANQLEVARAWGHPALVAAVGRLISRRAPTLADLARALGRVDHPEANNLARLCWALEQL